MLPLSENGMRVVGRKNGLNPRSSCGEGDTMKTIMNKHNSRLRDFDVLFLSWAFLDWLFFSDVEFLWAGRLKILLVQQMMRSSTRIWFRSSSFHLCSSQEKDYLNKQFTQLSRWIQKLLLYLCSRCRTYIVDEPVVQARDINSTYLDKTFRVVEEKIYSERVSLLFPIAEDCHLLTAS